MLKTYGKALTSFIKNVVFQIAFWPIFLQLKCFMRVFIVGEPKHTVKSGHFPFHILA